MDFIVAIDPGMSGAVAVLICATGKISVQDVPTSKNKKTGKEDYNISEMAELLRPYSGKNTVCMIEAVHAMPGNGSVSMFGFGRGKGIWEGIAHTLQFKVEMVAPQTWKKVYPELAAQKIVRKDTTGKTPKEKKEMDSALAKEKRLGKAATKAKARELATLKFPQHADVLKTVNSDGRAEALLMAVYMKEHFKEM